jgi:hypothetical protein
MRKPQTALLLFALFTVTLCAPGFTRDGSGSDVNRVMTEAMKDSPLQENLEELTDGIGGRVPGTPAMQHAIDWGVAAFKAAGADSVHTEGFPLQTSWSEGETRLSISAPEKFSVRAVSIAWAPALAAHQGIRVVDIGKAEVTDFEKAGNVAGALLLVHSEEMHTWDDLFAEYLKAPGIVDRAVKSKALAIAFQSTRPKDLMYRHTNSTAANIDRIPMVLVAREDAGRIARLLAAGKKLQADISIPNRIGGPVQAANVVAELRGSEKPDEFVVLGAHLDSWELGTGALDNGCNVALVIDSLRAMRAAGVKPKRSIRFVLFAGEEEGLVGSHAYTIAHRGELDKAAGVVIFDSGIGRVTGFSLGGRKDLVDATSALVEPLKQLDAAALTTDATWGTDNFDFLLQGVPTFVANQEEGNYLINYHASSDTFDKVDMAQLKKHVSEAAALTFALANTNAPIGRRLNHAEIEQTMHETHLDDQLKTFGMWNDWENGKLGRAQ